MRSSKVFRITLDVFAFGLAVGRPAAATDLMIGTWVRQSNSDSPPGATGLTMTVEAWGTKGGLKLAYRIRGNNDAITTIESPMDGTEAQVFVQGKPSAETMAIKRVDDHHMNAVLKLNGKQFGVSRGTISPDSKTLTVENEVTSDVGGTEPGKQIEIWIKQ